MDHCLDELEGKAERRVMTRREKEKKQKESQKEQVCDEKVLKRKSHRKESQKERVTERRTVTFVTGAVFGDAGALPFVAGALLLKEVLLEHEMLYFLKTQYTMPDGQTF